MEELRISSAVRTYLLESADIEPATRAVLEAAPSHRRGKGSTYKVETDDTNVWDDIACALEFAPVGKSGAGSREALMLLVDVAYGNALSEEGS
jgi:hypothetical protein